jgi:hypothetical protein
MVADVFGLLHCEMSKESQIFWKTAILKHADERDGMLFSPPTLFEVMMEIRHGSAYVEFQLSSRRPFLNNHVSESIVFQVITVQEPRTVMEPVAIQVPQVQTVQAIQMHHKIVEYERPRIVGGR